jgi:hypothetical protein
MRPPWRNASRALARGAANVALIFPMPVILGSAAMPIDGTYGIVYSGHVGLGVAVFTVSESRLEGRDWGGVRYTGTAVETETGKILVDVSQEIPPGKRLVTGVAPQDVPYQRGFREEMPPLFGDGQPVQFQGQYGTVTVMVKRIPDEYLTQPGSMWSRLLRGP